MLKSRSFDVYRNAATLIIVILGHLKLDMKVCDKSMENMWFDEYREMSEIDKVTNKIVTTI